VIIGIEYQYSMSMTVTNNQGPNGNANDHLHLRSLPNIDTDGLPDMAFLCGESFKVVSEKVTLEKGCSNLMSKLTMIIINGTT